MLILGIGPFIPTTRVLTEMARAFTATLAFLLVGGLEDQNSTNHSASKYRNPNMAEVVSGAPMLLALLAGNMMKFTTDGKDYGPPVPSTTTVHSSVAELVDPSSK